MIERRPRRAAAPPDALLHHPASDLAGVRNIVEYYLNLPGEDMAQYKLTSVPASLLANVRRAIVDHPDYREFDALGAFMRTGLWRFDKLQPKEDICYLSKELDRHHIGDNDVRDHIDALLRRLDFEIAGIGDARVSERPFPCHQPTLALAHGIAGGIGMQKSAFGQLCIIAGLLKCPGDISYRDEMQKLLDVFERKLRFKAMVLASTAYFSVPGLSDEAEARCLEIRERWKTAKKTRAKR